MNPDHETQELILGAIGISLVIGISATLGIIAWFAASAIINAIW